MKKLFSMGINYMSLAAWLGEGRGCSLGRVLPITTYTGEAPPKRGTYLSWLQVYKRVVFSQVGSRFGFVVRVIFGTVVFIKSFDRRYSGYIESCR